MLVKELPVQLLDIQKKILINNIFYKYLHLKNQIGGVLIEKQIRDTII
jgi:hypothetical protein